MRGNDRITDSRASTRQAADFSGAPGREHARRAADITKSRLVGSLREHTYSLVLLLALWLGPLSAAQAQVTVKDSGKYVMDRAGIISADYEQRLNLWLHELQQKTGAQVKILTVPSLEGEAIFDLAHRHAELWKLGQEGKDNGALIVVALKERKDRIHVGYGLEGVLPDTWCASLRRKVLIPYFKQNQFSEGMFRVAVSVANKVADDANVTLTGIPKYRHRAGRGRPSGAVCGGLFPLIMIFLVISSSRRRGRGYGRWGGGGMMQGLLIGGVLSSMMGGRRSHWGGGGFGGGGFGGGGFGSFGGGGGFGGGGAGGGGW